MKKPDLPVYFYGFTAMLFWGMSFIWTTILLRYYQPVTIIFLRLVISSSFLFLIIWLFHKKEQIHKKDIGLLVLSALFNPFLYFLGENNGLKFVTPAVTSVIIATIPVFSPVVAYIYFREKVSIQNLAGILLCFSGIVIMLINKQYSLNVDPKGIYFLSGAVLSALIYSVLLKKLTYRYSPLTIISWQNLIGIILFLPLFLVFNFQHFMQVKMNFEIISSLLLLAILASSVSYIFYTITLKSIGISKANIYTNLIPVFTSFFSYFIMSELFTAEKIAGIIMVIAGVFISEKRFRKKDTKNKLIQTLH
jgi:drug/metabolite transporter (DMT)-like permease